MAAVHECLTFLALRFKWYWTKRKQQSNLAQHQWHTLWNREYKWLIQLYGYVLQFQDTLQSGWLKHSNRVHGVSCIHGARVAARHCECSCPWLQSFVAYCCHSFCTCNAQLGLPQNAVHSSSITIFGASLSDPHPVRCMAGSAMYVGMSLYILMANFCCVCPLQFCTQWCAYLHTPGLGWKWLLFANVSNFPFGRFLRG